MRVAPQRVLGVTLRRRSLRLLGVNIHSPRRGLQLCLCVIRFVHQLREGPFPLWSSSHRQVRNGHLGEFRYDIYLLLGWQGEEFGSIVAELFHDFVRGRALFDDIRCGFVQPLPSLF